MDSIRKLNQAVSPTLQISGFCRNCGKTHRLGVGNCLQHSHDLMQSFEDLGTINLLSTHPTSAADLKTSSLFGAARGKMFGVMECTKSDGKVVFLYAFSGQYNGLWLVDGWVPPLFEVDQFYELTVNTEKQIKQLGNDIDQCTPHSRQWLSLRKKRRLLSRSLMRDIHNLYSLSNFRGKSASLEEAFNGHSIPTGTGDCCAPKLLNFAAKNNLQPTGMAEFFWGKENRSGSQSHGVFSSSCKEKCQPILGFMLCGLEE